MAHNACVRQLLGNMYKSKAEFTLSVLKLSIAEETGTAPFHKLLQPGKIICLDHPEPLRATHVQS